MPKLLTNVDLRRLIRFSMDAMASLLDICKTILAMIKTGKPSLNLPALDRVVLVR